ncbi:sulfatase-like hydrolase/transferase [Nocardioides ochotonae]|uniref:sulfatase-like hydrolase/transferase n=1 Tax=Nocardioides ochotonae TaxID=2685869 RepID=UPI00140D4C6D
MKLSRPHLGALSALAVLTATAVASYSPAASEPESTPVPGVVAPETGVQRPVQAAAGKRPNVMMITVDDMSIDDLRSMPQVTRELAANGATLTNTIAPTPICAPSRASMLTGQYAHNHGSLGVKGDHGGFQALDDRDTLPVWLRRAGYDTLFVGKYLNGYGEGGRGARKYVPPGWTDWRGSVDPTTYRFFGTKLNINGKVRRFSRYNTDLFAAQATDMLRSKKRADKPWYLWLNYVAPHNGGPRDPDDPLATHPGHRRQIGTTVPAPRHRDLFAGVQMPPKPSRFEADTSDKLDDGTGRTWDRTSRRLLTEAWQQRQESLRAIDQAVGEHVRVLRRTGQLHRTVIIFSSDNGFMMGEHNLTGKLRHYRESLQVPTIVRGPGVVRGANLTTLVSTADWPVTIAALARARPVNRVLDGVDVSQYWGRTQATPRVVPIEAYTADGGRTRTYSGIRYADRYTYVALDQGEELYDLRADPYELENVAEDPDYAPVLTQMRAWDEEFRDCRGASCPVSPITYDG